ncbi:MAG TPA: hypothetical protein VIS27_13850 [Yeosuana sp.]
MIPFFRKIRKTLADDNKPLKYLRYAIGEIVLVMIGILLALQVNNWNQERGKNILKESYRKNLIADLNQDIENLEQLNSLNTFAEQEGFYLAKYLNNSLVGIDTLRLTTSIFYCGYIPNITIISSTYNDLINSNNINSFNDIELKRLLDDYYIRNNWTQLFNNRILKTAWYDYRDEMLKFHSPLLYQDVYASNYSIGLNDYTKYHVEWNDIKKNKYLKKQVGMMGAYRIPIRNDIVSHMKRAKTILNYLEK